MTLVYHRGFQMCYPYANYYKTMVLNDSIVNHQLALEKCRLCPDMIAPPVFGSPVASKILLIGQAPGDKEPVLGRPFAWTAGKTLFRWFSSIGLDEDAFREKVYMSAVCRCFPGKNPKGGDRVPSRQEIDVCSQWLEAEIELLKPALIIPVGKVAILQYLEFKKLVDVIGSSFEHTINGCTADIIPLPHPSGASTWHRIEPGKHLLEEALALIKGHDAWKKLM